MLLVLALACSTPEPPKDAKSDKPTCDLKVDALAGTSWVNMKPQAAGPDQVNAAARVRFRDEGGKVAADYTAGSLNNVYQYNCSSDGKILTCVEQGEHAEGFCRASAANSPDYKCNVADVVAKTGLPQDKVEAAAKKVDEAYGKLKPEDREKAKVEDNSPNNKIRGKFLAAVSPANCGLTIQDKYQTLYNGQLAEYENVLGTARFSKADQDYTWLNCTESDSSWSPDGSDQHQQDHAPGTIKFSAILQKEQKGAPDCSYSADIYKDWLSFQKDVPAEADPKMGPRFNTSIPFTDKGKHVVYFDRYKTCGGKKESIGVSCVLVMVN